MPGAGELINTHELKFKQEKRLTYGKFYINNKLIGLENNLH